jgi:Protein of unknown function (DUF3298).
MVSACMGDGGPSPERTATQSDTEAAMVEEEIAGATEAPSEAPPATVAGAGRSVDFANDLYEFKYSYPDVAGAIPALKEILDGRMAESRSQLATSSADEEAAAKKDGFPYRQHSYGAEWKRVADLPGWLSLSLEFYTYTGGAHGMSGFDALLWDRRAETARKPRDLFASSDALRAAIRGPFCDALDKERERRRGEPVQRNSGQMFTECIDPMAQTLLLGSSNGMTFDRIGILVGPYEAGPYAEGSYEVTLPVTGKVMATLKPQYRSAFAVGQ